MLSSTSDLDESINNALPEDLFAPWKKDASLQRHFHSKSNAKLSDLDVKLLAEKIMANKSEMQLLPSKTKLKGEEVKTEETSSNIKATVSTKISQVINKKSIQPFIKSSKLSKNLFKQMLPLAVNQNPAARKELLSRQSNQRSVNYENQRENTISKDNLLMKKGKTEKKPHTPRRDFYIPKSGSPQIPEFNNMLEGPLYIGRVRKDNSMTKSISLKPCEPQKRNPVLVQEKQPLLLNDPLGKKVISEKPSIKADFTKRRSSQFFTPLDPSSKLQFHIQPNLPSMIISSRKKVKSGQVSMEQPSTGEIDDKKTRDNIFEKAGAYSVEIFNMCKHLENSNSANVNREEISVQRKVKIRKDDSKELFEKLEMKKKNDLVNLYRKLSSLSREPTINHQKKFRILKEQTPKRSDGLSIKINLNLKPVGIQ